MSSASMHEDVIRRYERVAANVPSGVTLIAVSKSQPWEKIHALYQLGHRDFGENYVQECVAKAETLSKMGVGGIRWHFLGHLQTNKVKPILPVARILHGLDSLKLALEIQKRNAGSSPIAAFIEVNVDEEASKSGVLSEQVPDLARRLAGIPEIELQGLMCVPRATESLARTRASFRKLATLRDRLGSLTHGRLSMGMTHDYEIAIEEGATHVRVGTGIFGERM